jgi:hypothetical protein
MPVSCTYRIILAITFATQVRVATLGLGTPALAQVWCTYRARTAPPPQRLDHPWPSYKCLCTLLPVRISNPAKDKIINGSRPCAGEASCVTSLRPGLDGHWLDCRLAGSVLQTASGSSETAVARPKSSSQVGVTIITRLLSILFRTEYSASEMDLFPSSGEM